MSTAIYVFIGYDEARRKTPNQPWLGTEFSGFMGIVDDMDRAAKLVDAYYDKRAADEVEFDYPGVWDYEVTEWMGQWMYERGNEWTNEEFMAEIERYVNEQIAANEARWAKQEATCQPSQ